MFGEFDSESPRVPSPWDSLTPPPSSPPEHNGIPKLVPEADEGNVEYKLQLLSPTPARFARLVTQLKWRLLEGGGQAYYELGVADSGMLIGLPRHHLEESLETLEMMAGEIGASVIVVKEIEVPPELSNIAQSQIDKWEDGKRNARRKDLLRMGKEAESLSMSPTGPETELSTTDVTDTEETTSSFPSTPPASLGGELCLPRPIPSLTTLPFDSALAMFTMDMGEDTADFADNEATDDEACTDYGVQLSINLEISTVYKPRPMKKRATHIMPPSAHSRHKKEKLKNGYPPSKSIDTTRTGDTAIQDPQLTGAKAQAYKDKRRALDTTLTVPIRRSTPPRDSVDPNIISPCSGDEPCGTASESQQTATVDPHAADASGTTAAVPNEPRLIVEALVVRKLSLDEAFLDFEGFSLQ